jgi:mannose-6-phosphate isomerase-like protein (cupin superfamily)
MSARKEPERTVRSGWWIWVSTTSPSACCGAAPAKPGTPITAISHAQVTEVYYVVSGGGTLVTGGTMVNATPLPAAGELVKVAVGPSRTGTFQGGNQMVVSAGDVVIIPAGVPHGFTDIKEQVTYLSIRPDPEKILPVGYVHPAIRR